MLYIFSLMNAICSFIGIYFNAKNRPHITLTKEEAKVSSGGDGELCKLFYF